MEDLFLDPLPHTWTTPVPDHENEKESSKVQSTLEESSIDLYDDLSMSSVRCDLSQGSPEKKVGLDFSKLISNATKQHISNTPPEAVSFPSKDSSTNLDLYTDHLVAELELKQKLEASESHNSKLNSQLKQLSTQNDQLRKNISSLFLTAKQEIQDKDLLIADLRAQLERQVSKTYQTSTKERKHRPNEMEKQNKNEYRSVGDFQDKKQYWDSDKKGEENSKSKNDNSPRLLNAYHSAQRRRGSLSKSKETYSQSNRGRFNSSKKNDSDSRKDRAIDETRHNIERKKEHSSNNNEFILCSDKKGDGFSKSKDSYDQKERDKEGSSKRGYDYKHTYKKVESFTKRDKTFSTIDKKNSISHDKDKFSDATNLLQKEEKRKELPANRGINDISDRIRKLPVKCSTSKFLSSDEEKSTEPRSGLSQKDSRNAAQKAFKGEAKYNCKTSEKDSSSKGPLDLRHKLKRKYESEKYPRQREENEPKKFKVESSQCQNMSSSFATSTIRHAKEQYIAKTTKLTQNNPSTAKDASKDKCQLKSEVLQKSNKIGQLAIYGEEKSKNATLGDENSNAQSQYDIGNERLQTNIVPVTEVTEQNSSKPVSESLKSNESSLMKEAVLSCEKPLFNANDTESKVKQHVHINNETSEHTFSFNTAKGKDIPSENIIEIETSHSFSPIVAPSTEADKMRPMLSAEPDLCKKPIFITPEMSNQESNSTASILSLPFANIKSVDTNSVSNLNSTNQTWPFEITESEQKNEANGIQLSAGFSNQTKPFDCISNPSVTKDLPNSNSNNKAWPFDTASSVQYSTIDHFKNKSSEQNELKKESPLCKNVLGIADFREADEVRAFPVSSSPKSHECEPDFTCKSLKCENEENSGDSSRSSAKSSTDGKDSTVVKSGSGKCSSKSSDGDTSSRSSSTDSGSSSAMSVSGSVNTGSIHPLSNAITPQNEDQSKKLYSNISADSLRTCDKGKDEEECDSEKSTSDDGVNCFEHQKTPFKRTEANSGETGIICTSNFIMLGDEETTCTTFASPSKPLSQPSEFYPPGVRGKIYEGGSHHRHIRGDSKVVFQPINATLDAPTSNSEASSEKSNSRDSGIIFEKSEDLTLCSQKVLQQRSESKKRQFDQSSNFMCESMEVLFDKAESTEVSSIKQKNLALTSDDKDATFFSDEIMKPELVIEKHKNESAVKNNSVFSSVFENSVDPKAMSSTIQGITSSHSNGPICITTEQDSLVPSLLSPTPVSKEAAYASEVGSDQKQSFEAWRNIVEQTYLNVFQQELQTFKNKLLDEALHSGDTATPEHMNKELKKLQCAVHEYIRSSRPTVSISSSKEENKNIAEISSNKFIARQMSPLQRSSGATFTQHSNTSVSKSDPQDQCHLAFSVKNIAQVNQGPASGKELDYGSFVSQKEMKTAKKRLFDQNF
ncbi:transmembrane and tpr repeat-containing protein 3 [Plakobranchus ocellatus]|uniref:Transmembrane and tpr repeat-containing protein 3 n=1 Tax=Plakobranchus ocellatus TaxID=259542 RepID=A0AAV4B2M4_9GAST|nr:transmembrane and tpr repeat-containing protein 3 [Plakobranchus ocellatus]